MKYILVTGGVISGIGKGIVASSIGTIIKACGIRVTSIKIDPYINIDAGTFSPFEHGEVFVLDDGGEVDLDLGNYERYLDVTLHSDNNITTGKIYQSVISKERRGDYLGKTVQVIPHITDAIQEWVERVAKIPVSNIDTNEAPEVCIIELGGTIGDIESMPFVEAFRQFQFRVKRENFCNVHVSLVPLMHGEHKTKPTQNSVKELRGLGLSPDMLICRSPTQISESVRDKLSMFSHVPKEQVICMADVSTLYAVPVILKELKLDDWFCERLLLNDIRKYDTIGESPIIAKYRMLAERSENLSKEVCIALVGKYTKQPDTYASMLKALEHASLACGRKLSLKLIDSSDLEETTKIEDPVKYHEAWQALCGADGVLVAGGFGNRGVEGKIKAIEWARTTKKPFLGICLGLQCAVIEYSRNVLGLKDANSSEFAKVTNQVVIEMPEHNPGQLGGTMRLGRRKTVFKSKNSVLRRLYGDVDHVDERHRHRYEVNPNFVPQLETQGMKFPGQSEDGDRMEIMELENHPFFTAVQYHPEYISRPNKPSAPYLGLVLASTGKLKGFLESRSTSLQYKLDTLSSSSTNVLSLNDSLN